MQVLWADLQKDQHEEATAREDEHDRVTRSDA